MLRGNVFRTVETWAWRVPLRVILAIQYSIPGCRRYQVYNQYALCLFLIKHISSAIDSHPSMSLSALPPEIVDSIVHYLALESALAPYASISALFQGAVEKRLLSSLHIHSPDLEVFARIIESNAHRKTAIRTITLTVVLPTYTDKACSWFEKDHEKKGE